MEERLAISITLFLSYLVLAIRGELAHTREEENISSILTNRHVNKTIQTGDGDVYDCVDIYMQPALNHPLLKNHVIQMEPSSYPLGLDIQSTLASNISQAHPPNIECPSGTIPILRHDNEDIISLSNIGLMASREGEHAAIKYWDDNIYGTHATINIYEPFMKRKNGDLTASWAQINNGDEAIGAGSIVWPAFSGDEFARFHIHWVDKLNKPCYDHRCPGFVQVSQTVGLGARIQPISVYNGPQYAIIVVLFQDPSSKDWWLAMGDETIPTGYRTVGYWPSSLFSSLKKKATFGIWGGLVRGPTSSSDPPVMGSGHFASEGYGKAAFVRDIRIVGQDGKFTEPNIGKARPASSRVKCYSVDRFRVANGSMRVYYGGPGHCPE